MVLRKHPNLHIYKRLCPNEDLLSTLLHRHHHFHKCKFLVCFVFRYPIDPFTLRGINKIFKLIKTSNREGENFNTKSQLFATHFINITICKKHYSSAIAWAIFPLSFIPTSIAIFTYPLFFVIILKVKHINKHSNLCVCMRQSFFKSAYVNIKRQKIPRRCFLLCAIKFVLFFFPSYLTLLIKETYLSFSFVVLPVSNIFVTITIN